MIVNYARDGEECIIKQILQEGFMLNTDKDITKFSSDDNEQFQTNKTNFNFVGFITNQNNNLFMVIPKGYKVSNLEDDAKLIFTTIQKHKQKNPDRYIGNQYGEKYISNFPFAAFWGIYNYYNKFGLYHEIIEKTKPNINGKINWKVTLKQTSFYIIDNDIFMFPYFYSKKYNLNTIITECMIYAIDYTINKFHCLLNIEGTGKCFPEYDFLNNKEKIIKILQNAKTLTFNDTSIELLNNLINFFQNLNQGGTYYFKTYVFEYLWEDIVVQYLNDNFVNIDNNNLIFNTNNTDKKNFTKATFHPNAINKNHIIEPDFYYTEGDTQYIFDAKYKKHISGIDYKQVCYSLFLKNIKKDLSSENMYNKTYSALLIPDDYTHSKLHFKIDPLYNKEIGNVDIIEQYLDIKEIMQWYINK